MRRLLRFEQNEQQQCSGEEQGGQDLAISKVIEGISVKSSHSKSEPATLRGRLQYAETHTYGRIAIPSMRLVGEVATGQRRGSPLDTETKVALNWLVERLQSAAPTPIIADNVTLSVVIFVDAASEGTKHTFGGMLYDKLKGVHEFVSMTISESLVREWKSDGGSQIIGQAELYPVWLVRKQWSSLLAGRRILIH